MTYNLQLAKKLIPILMGIPHIDEMKMFGGTCFLLNGNMLCGVYKDNLIVRLGKDGYAQWANEPHTLPFDITGKPMSGWLMVEPAGWQDEATLKRWVVRALAFVETLPPK